MNEKLPKLLISNKEKDYVITAIEQYPEYFPDFEVVELVAYDDEIGEYFECGDFSNENYSFICEGKVIHLQEINKRTGFYKEGDFHTSLTSKRLQDQLAKMHIYYAGNRWLLCRGYLLNYSVAHPKTANYAASMIGYCGLMNISFRECYDMDDFLWNLYWINKESGKKPLKRSDVRTEAKWINKHLVALSKFPGIGMKRAKILLEECGNLAGLKEAYDSDKLIKLKYIGESTVIAVRDFFYEEVILEEIKRE